MKTTAIVLTVLALGAGCTGRAVPPAAPHSQPGTAGQLSALFERITGTREDRSAASFLQYATFQKPIRECMTRNGFDYTPPPFEDPYRSWPANRPMSYIDVLIPIDEQQIARGLYLTEDHRGARQQPPNPGFDKLDEAGRRRYSAMAGTCSPLPGSYEYEFPQASLDLAWKLEKTLANILATSDVLRDMATSKYPACMAAAGYPVKDRKQLAEHVRGKHFEGIEAAAELNAAYEAEVAAARADALCRKDSYPLAMRLIAPVLPEFEKEHSTKIAEVEAHWSNIRDKAKRARAELTW